MPPFSDILKKESQLIINLDSDMNQNVKQGQDRLTNIPNYSMT